MTTENTAHVDHNAGGPFGIPARSVWRRLSPMHFLTAIAIGIVEVFFLALTYAEIPLVSGQLLVDHLALYAAMAACVALNRSRNRASAWALLAIAYVFLVLTIVHHPDGRELIIGQIMAHCLVLAVFVADQAVASESPGRLTYIVAVVVGVAAGAFIWAAVLKFGPNLFTDKTWEAEAASPYFVVLHPVYVAMVWLLFAGAAVLFYGERRLAAMTLQRLRDAELERIRRSRELIESTLQTTQARVEPQFLFNTLAHVRQFSRHDPRLAERMLDELVSFLRAAMPRLRDTSSVVEQEAELARAYLGILCMHPGNHLAFEMKLAADAARARLPSMLLLPLIDHVVTKALHFGFGDVTLRIGAAVENGHLVIRVVNALGYVNEIGDADAVAVLRERLAALYGERANIGFAVTSVGDVEAVLDVPYEPAA